MSHLCVPDKSDRSTNEFPSRSMSWQENIVFEEKLNSRGGCGCSSSSSVTSGSSDISDIPPPPPLEDDDNDDDTISHCSYISRSILHSASNRIETVEGICSGICRSSATAVTNQKPDVGRSSCNVSKDDTSHPCSVMWENGKRILASASTCGSNERECSNTNHQIAVACEGDDTEIDMNFDLSNACEHEDCKKAKDSTCCSAKCNNSTTGGEVDHKPIGAFDFWDIPDKIIDASCAGSRHEDRCIAIFANVQDGDDDVSILIGPSIPRLENGRHRSGDSILSLRSVRSKHHENQSTRGNARVDPPARNEDGDAPSFSLFPADHRSDKNRALRDCFLILKVFALRCTFDHWRRKTKFEEQSSSSLFEPLSFDNCDDFDMMSLLSSHSNVSPSILSPDVFSVTSVRNVRLRPISSPFQKPDVHQRKKQIQSYKIFDHVFERVTMRRALIKWAEKTKLVSWYNSILQARALMVHRRILEKSLHSWREVTVAALEFRQKYFLMMIFNRWKCYTDECIDLRQMRYIALIHWASVKCKKSFVALKLNATQNKEANTVTSLIQSKCGSSASTRSRNTFIQHGLSSADRMTYNSAAANDGRGQSHDHKSRKNAEHFSYSGKQEMYQSDNFRGSFLKPGSISPPTFIPRNAPSHNLYSLHALRDESCRGINYSDGRPMPVFRSLTSHEQPTPFVAGMFRSRSQNLNLTRSGQLLTCSQTRQHNNQCEEEVNIDVPFRRPALRSTSDFIISNVLDEMISKVERRHFGYTINCDHDMKLCLK